MNLIVIVLDSLRVDHVGCYGGSVGTPNIDSLANDGATMDQAYSENMPTQPCRTAWWTGRHLFTSRGWAPFEPEDLLLAETLSSRGYISALITDTYHMHRPGYNNGRGFDTTAFIRGQEYDPWVVDKDLQVDLTRHHKLRGDETDALWRGRFTQYLKNRSRFVSEEDHCAPRVFKTAVSWLEQARAVQKDRIFLWIDSFSPHEPWDPPERYRTMYDPDYDGTDIIDPVPGPIEGYLTAREVAHIKHLYGGCVTFVDAWLGFFLDNLKRLGLYDDSVIVLTSDHGEPFGEHGIIRKARPCCYEELAHIPLIIRHPQGLGSGQRFAAFTQPPDIFPTLVDLLGIDFTGTVPGWFGAQIGAAPPFTGKSLVPILEGKRTRLWEFAVSAYFGKQWSLRTGEWTYLHNLTQEPNELYRRDRDPQEQTNVIESHKEIAGELEATLASFAQTVAPVSS